MTFVLDGVTRSVSLEAPMSIWRGSAWRVRLIDLWVATSFPGDIFDLRFKILTSGVRARVRSAVLDGMSFAGGYVGVGTRELWWDAGQNEKLVGCRARSIVAHTRGVMSASELERKAPTESGIDLKRILPITRTPYPPVRWRRAR
jgi:hypothetical protein